MIAHFLESLALLLYLEKYKQEKARPPKNDEITMAEL